MLSSDRALQQALLRPEEADETLAALRAEAAAARVWLLIGSLGIKTGDADGRFANRSFLIATEVAIAARYDKIHMFDVDVSPTERYRESEGYRPGTRAVVADAGRHLAVAGRRGRDVEAVAGGLLDECFGMPALARPRPAQDQRHGRQRHEADDTGRRAAGHRSGPRWPCG